MDINYPHLQNLLADLESKFHLDKVKPIIAYVTVIIKKARMIDQPLMTRIEHYQKAIKYFQTLEKILSGRPMSEKLGLEKYHQKITDHLESFSQEVAILINSQKVSTPYLPFEQLQESYRQALEKYIILPIMNPNFYQKNHTAILVSGEHGMGKTFIVRATVKYLQTNNIDHIFLEMDSDLSKKSHTARQQNYLSQLCQDFQYLEDNGNKKPVIVLLDDFDLYLSQYGKEALYELEKLRQWSLKPNIFIVATSSTRLDKMISSLSKTTSLADICQRFFQGEINIGKLQQTDIVHFFDYQIHQYLVKHLWKKPVKYFRSELRIPLLQSRQELQRLAVNLHSKDPNYEQLHSILTTGINTASMAALHHNIFYPLKYEKETIYLSDLSLSQKPQPQQMTLKNQPHFQKVSLLSCYQRFHMEKKKIRLILMNQ